MHPIERLRYVARASTDDASLLVREAAGALGGLGSDLSGVVTACRRIVDRQVWCGPLWWLCARVLSAGDQRGELRRVVADIDADRTLFELGQALPDDATVVIAGRIGGLIDALAPRGDCQIILIDTLDESNYSRRRLERADVDVTYVSGGAIGPAVARANLVLLDAVAVGPHDALVPSGGSAAAACAYVAGIPVWLVAEVGRLLPAQMWEALRSRYADEGDPWDLDFEVVRMELISQLCGPSGPESVADGLRRTACPVTPELFRPTAF